MLRGVPMRKIIEVLLILMMPGSVMPAMAAEQVKTLFKGQLNKDLGGMVAQGWRSRDTLDTIHSSVDSSQSW